MSKRTMIIGAALVAVVLVYVFGGPKTANSAPAPAADQCRVSVTADVLNVRSAPDPKADVVGKYSKGAQTNAAKQVTNGFRKLGDDKWAAAQFLTDVSGKNCT